MAISKKDQSLYVWSGLRIVLGFVFLWAFFDKLFGLGFATCRDNGGAIASMCSDAWVKGGSPTEGFLSNAVSGPFADFYHNLAGNTLVDWAFMSGLLVVGLGLLLGTWIKLAASVGILMLALMYSALLWPENNPAIDEHIIYILVLFGIFGTADQAKWSLQGWWKSTSLGQRFHYL